MHFSVIRLPMPLYSSSHHCSCLEVLLLLQVLEEASVRVRVASRARYHTHRSTNSIQHYAHHSSAPLFPPRTPAPAYLLLNRHLCVDFLPRGNSHYLLRALRHCCRPEAGPSAHNRLQPLRLLEISRRASDGQTIGLRGQNSQL